MFTSQGTINLYYNGMWLSLVERYIWDVDAAGSNPVIPTKGKCVVAMSTVLATHESSCFSSIRNLGCINRDLYAVGSIPTLKRLRILWGSVAVHIYLKG